MAYNTFTDPRDGKTYPCEIMADLNVWTTQNLAFDAGEGSWNIVKPGNDMKYWGFAYNWYAAQKAVPDGWKIPSFEEWRALLNLYNNDAQALTIGGSSGLELDYVGTYIPSKHINVNAYKSGSYWASNNWESNGYTASFLFKTGVHDVEGLNSGNNLGNAIRLIKCNLE